MSEAKEKNRDLLSEDLIWIKNYYKWTFEDLTIETLKKAYDNIIKEIRWRYPNLDESSIKMSTTISSNLDGECGCVIIWYEYLETPEDYHKRLKDNHEHAAIERKKDTDNLVTAITKIKEKYGDDFLQTLLNDFKKEE